MFTRVAKARHLLDTGTHNKKQTFCLLQTCSCLLISEYYFTSTPVHLLTYLGSVQEIFLGEVGQYVCFTAECVRMPWAPSRYICERLTSQHICIHAHAKAKAKSIWQL